MKRLLGISMVAFFHLACSYALWITSVGIGMKTFDSPQVLTLSEKVWTSVTRIMFLPVADPLQRLGRDLIKPLMDSTRYSYGVRGLVATVWFLGPLVLNSGLWALLIWWAYPRVRRRLGSQHAA
jgi:hypothetical protein